MVNIDEYVVHTTGGICRVAKIAPLEISGADRDRMYYLLVPVKASGSKVYVPVDNESAIRRIITVSEANSLIEEIPSIDEFLIENEKHRENIYKEVIKSCNLRDLVGILKSLNYRRSQRLKEGKKNTATDEKYYRIAEENLLSELSFVLGKDRTEIQEMISAGLAV